MNCVGRHGHHDELLKDYPADERGEVVRYLVDGEVWTKLNDVGLPVEPHQVNGYWYKVIPVVPSAEIKFSDYCGRCHFYSIIGGCDNVPCGDDERSDGLSVYFKVAE